MKVLIVKISSLGDIVHTLPALTDAKKNIPDISFDWVVEESFSEIPAWHPAVDEVIPIAWRRWRKNLLKAFSSGEVTNFFKKLRSKKYDLIIDAQGLIKSSVISKLASGVGVGYDKNSAREKHASFLYKNRYNVSRDLHAISRIRELFSLALNYQLQEYSADYGIDKRIFKISDNNEKYLVFLHGTSKEEKCWNEQKWVELAKFALENGFIVYLPWGNNEEFARAKRIASCNQAKIRVLPKLKVSSIAALLNEASGAVAPDTGLGHVAAALGVPTISLYGPSNVKLTGTVGKNQGHLLDLDKIEAADVWQRLCKMIV